MPDDYALALRIMKLCGFDMSDDNSAAVQGVMHAVVALIREARENK